MLLNGDSGRSPQLSWSHLKINRASAAGPFHCFLIQYGCIPLAHASTFLLSSPKCEDLALWPLFHIAPAACHRRPGAHRKGSRPWLNSKALEMIVQRTSKRTDLISGEKLFIGRCDFVHIVILTQIRIVWSGNNFLRSWVGTTPLFMITRLLAMARGAAQLVGMRRTCGHRGYCSTCDST